VVYGFFQFTLYEVGIFFLYITPFLTTLEQHPETSSFIDSSQSFLSGFLFYIWHGSQNIKGQFHDQNGPSKHKGTAYDQTVYQHSKHDSLDVNKIIVTSNMCMSVHDK
jgi:hypothetical protein